MSDQLEIRLSSLRDAAAQIQDSTLRLADSLASVRSVLHELAAIGYENPTAAAGAAQPLYAEAQLERCVDNLNTLGNQLRSVADAVEGASVAHFPPLGALWKPATTRSVTTVPLVAAALPVAAFNPSRYVSAVNRPLYDEWRQDRDALSGQEAHLQALLASRAGLVNDLRALRNRLSSTPGGDAAHDLEVIRLKGQIDQIDNEVAATRQDIDRLQGQVNTLTRRLERVAPGAGANLAELHLLEQGESSAGLKAYTEDCVNYIVQRVHVPSALGHDAYLWNDIAAANPQYGIRASQTPLVGSILVMEREHSYANDVHGHLMYVERVENGQVWITDNTHPNPIRLSDLTTETSGQYLTYLMLPWHTSG